MTLVGLLFLVLVIAVVNYLIKDIADPGWLGLFNKIATVVVVIYAIFLVMGMLGVAVPRLP